MPWPSNLTAQLTGQYGQMNQVLGIGGGGFGPNGMGMAADSIVGAMGSRAGASAGPLLQGAMGMSGFDPMSMGMRAGMGAWNMGAGLGTAGMVGMGVAGGVAAVGMAAQWGAGQMYQGAQQQSNFNTSMRQNFSFMNNAGGQGFNRQELSGISGQLRSMTESYGAGGEVNTFGELSKIASNMGKMGLTTGVRDAQEFGKKFKEMVSTLKTVATELGTSLESAQELLSSARGSGIFKNADQLKFGSSLRATGLAGGLATSEMTAMGNIGAQVSRAVGGLGRQGAMGGIKTLGQVGTATQVGALSEEDIYNSTGLTGAEGRQAMATNMMQSSGNFMKSSKGRFFLASIAGKNGSLDMDAVQQYMSGGGMSVNETRDKAHSNLAGVGRANFIRNEGRLRGAAMEQFGGLAPALALQGWARGKGIDINDMDDKSMLFAQKHLGMGRDELDSTIKIAQSLPKILQEQRRVASDDAFSQARGQSMKSHDFRTRIDQFKEKIQGTVQKFGADLQESGSSFVEGMLNRVLDNYEQRLSGDISGSLDRARFGGAGSAKELHGMMGTSASIGRGQKAMDALGFGRGLASGGYSAGSNTDAKEAMRLGGMTRAAKYGQADSAFSELSERSKSAFNEAYGMGLAGKQGDDRLEDVGRLLRRQATGGNAEAAALWTKWKAGSATERAAMTSAMERSAGVHADARLSFGQGDLFKGGGGFRSVDEANRAIGQAFTGSSDRAAIDSLGVAGTAGYGLAMGSLAVARALVWHPHEDDKVGSLYAKGKEAIINTFARSSAGGKFNQAVGATFQGPEGLKMLQDMVENGQSSAAFQKMQQLQGGTPYEKLDVNVRGTISALQMAHLGAEYSRAGTPEERAAIRDKANHSAAIREAMGGDATDANIKDWAQAGEGALGMAQIANNAEAAKKMQFTGKSDTDSMAAGGILEMVQQGGKGGPGKMELSLSGRTYGELKGVKNGSQAANLALAITKQQEGLVNLTDPQALADAMEGIHGDEAKLASTLGDMSLADKLKFAKSFSGTTAGRTAMDLAGGQSTLQGLMKATGGNAGAATARGMGLRLSKEEEKSLQGMDQKQVAATLAKAAGMGGDQGFMSALTDSLSATGAKGGPSNKAGLLLQQAVNSLSPEAQKKIKSDQAADKDPLQKDIADNTKTMVDILNNMHKTDVATQGYIVDLKNKDPEKNH